MGLHSCAGAQVIEATRLLAFAFASADLLFEVDRSGTVAFIAGAAGSFSKEPNLVGRTAAELFAAQDVERFQNLVRSLRPGERAGPMPITLTTGGEATLAMCFLPQNERISCTLVRPSERSAISVGGLDKETGLPGPTEFLATAMQNVGSSNTVALVDVPNLNEVREQLSPEVAAAVMHAIGDNLKSMNALIAARLSKTSFGVVAADELTAKSLVGRIRAPAALHSTTPLKIEQTVVSLKDHNLTKEQIGLALRYVINSFVEGHFKAAPASNLADLFEEMMIETVTRARDLYTTIAEGAFQLVFEPIVELKTGIRSHYEVLTRFNPDESPAETIQFAEQLALANSFDLALISKAFGILDRDSAIIASVAVNVSGRSIADPAAFAMLAGLLSKKRNLARRVLVEITETSEMKDLPAANEAIQSLRKMGFRVGIDDFGAGAATVDYLHNLHVDFVKVDGGLIKRLGQSEDETTLLKAVLRSCAEMKVDTIAEWIDTHDKFKRCAEMGFRFGQGRYFGSALKELPKVARAH